MHFVTDQKTLRTPQVQLGNDCTYAHIRHHENKSRKNREHYFSNHCEERRYCPVMYKSQGHLRLYHRDIHVLVKSTEKFGPPNTLVDQKRRVCSFCGAARIPAAQQASSSLFFHTHPPFSSFLPLQGGQGGYSEPHISFMWDLGISQELTWEV